MKKRMKPEPALQLIRKVARRHGYTVEEVPGRGKGSHQTWAIFDADGSQIGRFGLTRHPREMSWTVLHGIEDGLAHLFGENWMEK